MSIKQFFDSLRPPWLRILPLFYSKADISEMDIIVWGLYKDSNFEVKHEKELHKNNKS